MLRSITITSLAALLLSSSLVAADLPPFLNPDTKTPNGILENSEHHTRRLKELKSIAIQRRYLQQRQYYESESLEEPGVGDDNYYSPDEPHTFTGASTDEPFEESEDPGFDLGGDVSPDTPFVGGKGKGGKGKGGKGKGGKAGKKCKKSSGKAGKGKGGKGKGDSSSYDHASAKSSKKSGYDDCDGEEPSTDIEFVMVSPRSTFLT